MAARTETRRSLLVRRAVVTGRLLALAALATLAPLSGCATWDTEAFFPEDYQQRFTKLHNCKKSAHPTGDHVVVWINDIGRDAFTQRQFPLPQGTVLVKTQYSDSACSRLSRYTAMEKGAPGDAPDANDWLFQLVDERGGVRDCCSGGDPTAESSCVGCHTPCVNSDLVCTAPPAAGP